MHHRKRCDPSAHCECGSSDSYEFATPPCTVCRRFDCIVDARDDASSGV